MERSGGLGAPQLIRRQKTFMENDIRKFNEGGESSYPRMTESTSDTSNSRTEEDTPMPVKPIPDGYHTVTPVLTGTGRPVLWRS